MVEENYCCALPSCQGQVHPSRHLTANLPQGDQRRHSDQRRCSKWSETHCESAESSDSDTVNECGASALFKGLTPSIAAARRGRENISPKMDSTRAAACCSETAGWCPEAAAACCPETAGCSCASGPQRCQARSCMSDRSCDWVGPASPCEGRPCMYLASSTCAAHAAPEA